MYVKKERVFYVFPDQGGENMKMVPTRQRRKKRKAGDGDINYNTYIFRGVKYIFVNIPAQLHFTSLAFSTLALKYP